MLIRFTEVTPLSSLRFIPNFFALRFCFLCWADIIVDVVYGALDSEVFLRLSSMEEGAGENNEDQGVGEVLSGFGPPSPLKDN